MKPLKNLDAWNPTSQEILDGFINILEINLNKNWKKTMHNIAEVTVERNAWDNQCQFTSEVIMLQDLCWKDHETWPTVKQLDLNILGRVAFAVSY